MCLERPSSSHGSIDRFSYVVSGFSRTSRRGCRDGLKAVPYRLFALIRLCALCELRGQLLLS
jgi:hypothetical protein